ncbi:MAG: adenylate/guanylate cyclase domain-containing protein, partial [Cyanobacteria bacterium J06636_28]
MGANGRITGIARVSVPVTLRNGDALTFGQTELQFYCPAPEPSNSRNPSIGSHDSTATATLHVRRL